MSLFVAVIALSGEPIAPAQYAAFERRLQARKWAFRRYTHDAMAVFVLEGSTPTTMVAGVPGGCAAGIVRLDNRVELQDPVSSHGSQVSDLAIAGHGVLNNGWRWVSRMLGDFAFIVWDRQSRTVLGASDAIGVKRLYWKVLPGVIAFSSRAEALSLDDTYDLQYLAERVASSQLAPELTPYRGVSALAPGSVLMLTHEARSSQTFWTPEDFSGDAPGPCSVPDAADTCRQLFARAVQDRLGAPRRTWAQLSGGMDSSSVVSVAQWLARRGQVPNGLTGVFTYIDCHGSGGDERRYATAVATQWEVNHEILDCSPAPADPITMPLTDEPCGSLETVIRDYQVCDLLARRDVSVLLTGAGGDVLFGGTMLFFADWVARGHLRAAAVEMTRRAVIGRASFWELAYRNALLPLLPRSLRRHLVDEWGQVPAWVSPMAVRRYDLRDRAVTSVLYGGRVGRKYGDAAAAMIRMIPVGLNQDIIEEAADVRHPFYARPLVEFALRLPPTACVQPHARKWVLRQAMRGILPDLVRERIGKGSYGGAVSWWLSAKQDEMERLTTNSILGELGLIDVQKLRDALAVATRAREDRAGIGGAVLATLSVEAWLQARSGRWPAGPYRSHGLSLNRALPT